MKPDIHPAVHVCCKCGFQWQSLDKKTERLVINSVKVNQDGPYCSLCQSLAMAGRYAGARDMSLTEAVEKFINAEATRSG